MAEPDHPSIVAIVKTLQRERLNSGMGHRVANEKLGYGGSAIWNWESRTRCPNLRSLVDWCDLFGFEVVLRKKSERCSE